MRVLAASPPPGTPEVRDPQPLDSGTRMHAPWALRPLASDRESPIGSLVLVRPLLGPSRASSSPVSSLLPHEPAPVNTLTRHPPLHRFCQSAGPLIRQSLGEPTVAEPTRASSHTASPHMASSTLTQRRKGKAALLEAGLPPGDADWGGQASARRRTILKRCPAQNMHGMPPSPSPRPSHGPLPPAAQTSGWQTWISTE